MGYRKQGNQKIVQVGTAHPDRNGQFEFIHAKVKEFFEADDPEISVDTKKEGKYRKLQEFRRGISQKQRPAKGTGPRFSDKRTGKDSALCGVYYQNNTTGFVNHGTSHDTPDFAVASIARWWYCLGKHTFPQAAKLLVTCDCGGSNGCSNGYRNKLWKFRLAQLAEQIGLDIHVSHFPPGTSKRNKVEHRLFCYISRKWQGKPLIDVETAIHLIGATTTSAGLKIIFQRDDAVYKIDQSVSDDEYKSIPLTSLAPFESWNYVLNHITS
jgi:hypothetical protein